MKRKTTQISVTDQRSANPLRNGAISPLFVCSNDVNKSIKEISVVRSELKSVSDRRQETLRRTLKICIVRAGCKHITMLRQPEGHRTRTHSTNLYNAERQSRN